MEDISQFEYHETGESYDVGKHGKDYELEMAKFLLKRIIDMNYNNFHFTREKKGLGKFDDLVFIIDEENRSWYSLVQLKHILNEKKNINYESLADDVGSYFYLPKYFSYFLESSSSWNEDIFFQNAELESLLICTNIDFEDNLNDIKKFLINNDGIFKTSGNLYKLFMSQDVKRKIFSKFYVPDYEMLAKELCMYVMLNKHIDINNLVKHEHASLIKQYHIALSLYVIDCDRKTFKSEFLLFDLDSTSSLFLFRKALIDCINDLYSKCQMLDNEKLKNELGITLKRVKYLKTFLEKYCPSNPLEFLRNLSLSVRKRFGEPVSNYIQYNTLPNERTIDIENIDRKIDIFLSKLVFAVGQKDNESILRMEMSTDLLISFNDKMNMWYHSGSSQTDSKMFRKREWITKEKIIKQAMRTEINFQNRKVWLDQLLEDQTVLDSSVIMRVFCSREINIGKVIQKKGDKDYYISRLLMRKRHIRKKFLKESNQDIVILTENQWNLNENDVAEFIQEDETLFTLENINLNTRFLFVGQNKIFGNSEFDAIVDRHKINFEGKNVHWLEIRDEYLLWRKTHGSLSILQNYFKEDVTKHDIICESELEKYRGIIVVEGEPGMGKSTLLHHNAESRLLKSTATWVIKVNIKDILYELGNSSNFKNLENILQLLADLENIQDTFSLAFLRYCLMKRKAILMFDGFDEVRTSMEEKNLVNMISCLKVNCDVEQIFITTRPHRKVMLENKYGVLAFSIKEINQEQQVWFLSKFWVQSTKKPWHSISEYSTTLIENLNNRLTSHGKKFLGIPLQTYMFAISYMQEIMKEKPEIYDIMEVTSLFDKFLHTKYELYFKKLGVVSLPDDIKILIMKLFDEIHQNFALCKLRLLPYLNPEEFSFNHLIIKDERLLDIGLVYNSNETFHFIHKTFAEYFIAKRLVNIAMHEQNNSIQVLEILKKLIENHESKFMLYLFDYELVGKYPLHKCVLQGLETEVEKFHDDEIDSKDCLNRSLHYYAVQYRHFNIMNILLRKKSCLNENDMFLVYASKAYLHNCYKHDLKSLNLTNEFFSKLFDSSFNFSLKIIDAFDIGIELERKNWNFVHKILRARQVSGNFGNNLYYLDNALKRESPIDIVLLLLESIKNNKNSQEEYTVAYTHFMKYLFACKPEFIEKLLRRYKISLKYRSPLFVGVYEYFDLRQLYFGNSLASFIETIEERSNHFTLIVKLLLENGATYLVLKNNNDIVFNEKRINLRFLKMIVTKFIEDNFRNEKKYFNLTLDQFLKQEDLSSQMDSCRKVIKKYQNIATRNSQETVNDFIFQIVFHILKNSDAAKLFQMVYNFHIAVASNDFRCVAETLIKSKKHAWKKALLNSNDDAFRTPMNVAKDNHFLRIYILLRRNQ